MRIGVDTGGTFTDVVFVANDVCLTHKLLSTPKQPGEAVLAGIGAVLRAWFSGKQAPGEAPLEGDFPSDMRVVHGSTVATNALLEGKGGKVAFVTNAGFEDVLWIGRQARPSLYALSPQAPTLPLARDCVFGLPARVGPDGEELVPLLPEMIEELVARLRASSWDALAICFLHSYANPRHEEAVAAACRAAFPARHVTVSSELVREFREYERASTTMINAAAAPPMCRYIGGLTDALGEERLRVMGSAGGLMQPAQIEAAPAHTIVSGPAGGVVGALTMARTAGISEIITFDMGGTSTDVSLCLGEPARTLEGGIAGFPVRLSMLDIETVGAGGGSLVWLDAGGSLQIGPTSLGAMPGPACYGAQEAPFQPTVTDAHLVVGHLYDGQRLAGRLPLQAAPAKAAIQALAEAASMSLEMMAAGILRVADVVMARAIQRISTQRGHDPRDFVLVPFGGAGGLHACQLAAQVGIRQVLLPPHAGLLSAVGMLAAAPRYEASQGLMVRVEGACALEAPAVKAACGALREALEASVSGDGGALSELLWETRLDLRYEGQSYELQVPVTAATTTSTRALFEEEHMRLYGYTAPGRAMEVVAVRMVAGLPGQVPSFAQAAKPGKRASAHAPNLQEASARIYTASGWLDGKRYWREDLCVGAQGEGPAIVHELSGTTVIPKGWTFEVLPGGAMNLIMVEQVTR